MVPTKKQIFILCILFVCLLAGCKTLGAPVRHDRTWENPIAQKEDAAWSSIKNKKIDTAKKLTLTDIVNIALKNNPSTQKAWQDARSAQADAGIAKSELFPQATASFDLTKERSVSARSVGNYNDLHYGPQVQMTYLLLDFGGRSARIKETAQQLLAANFQFNQSIQDLLFNSEKAYYDLYAGYADVDAAESDVKDSETALTLAKSKFEAKLASQVDVLSAQSDYENKLYSLEDAKKQLKSAQADLAAILGYSADTKIEIIPPSTEIPTQITKQDIGLIIDDALKSRPDIARQRSNVAVKEQSLKSAYSDLLPTLSASGTAQKPWYKIYGVGGTQNNSYNYTAGLSLQWDLFDGFKNYNQVQKAKADLEAQIAQLEQAELKAAAEVWTKYYSFIAAIQKYAYGKSYYNSAKASHELTLESYNVGLKGIVDLLNAQRDLSNARSTLIAVEKDLYTSLIDLSRATGSLNTNNAIVTENIQGVNNK